MKDKLFHAFYLFNLASDPGDILDCFWREFLPVEAGGADAVAIPQTSMTILNGLRNENIL